MTPWTFYFGLALLAGGVISIGGAALNLDRFMESPKAERFVERFGRNGARVFYVLLGVVFVVLGASVMNMN